MKSQSDKFQLSAVFDKSNDGILLLSTKGRILYANPACCNFFSKEPDDLVGKPFGMPLVRGDMTTLDLNSSSGISTVEMRILEVIIDGKSRLVAFLHDITSHVKLENRMKIQIGELLNQASHNDQVLSLIAHDLRSPFNVLLNMSEYLATSFESMDKAEIRKHLNSLHNSSRKVFNLLLNLLDWSRIKTRQLKSRRQMLKVSDVVTDVLDIYSDIAADKDITIVNLISDEVEIFADENILSAVLRNLISNSIKFTSPGGIIRLEHALKDHQMLLNVKDNGIGMTEAQLARLFDPVRTSEKNHPESGTGLGLLLCKELVKISDGSLKVESTYGQGTTVSCSFPIRKS